jgi:hypothetical protein
MQELKTGTQSTTGVRQMEWSYYDTITLAQATLQTRMFTQGLAGSAKSLWQTNMKLNGLIPTGERMNVSHIKVMYTQPADIASTVLTDINKMLNYTTVEVKISGSDSILTMTVQELMGIPLLASQTALAGMNAVPNPVFNGVYKLKRPIVFAENQTVEVLVTHQVAIAAGIVGGFLKLSLNGILERRLA